MNSYTLISVLVIISYLIVIKLISLLAYKQSSKTLSDYFLVNRSLKGVLFWATIIATIINGLAFTAVPALFYQGGVLFLQMVVVVIVVPILIRVFGPKVREYASSCNCHTQGDLFGTFYQSSTIKKLTGFIGIAAVIPFLVIQLSAVGKVTAVVTSGNISYSVAILIFAFSTGFYIFYGGARAVVWTDLVQAFCFFILLAVTAYLFTQWQGGYVSSASRLLNEKPELFSFNQKTFSIFINNSLSWPFAFFLWPQLFTRLFMAKDNQSIIRSAKATFVIFAFIMFLIFTIGFMATAEFVKEQVAPDTLIAEMYGRYLPSGSLIILLAVIASGVSTLDSGILAVSAICLKDFTIKFREVSDARKIALIVLTIITFFSLSSWGQRSMAQLVTLGASFATILIWPLLGFYWNSLRANQVVFIYLSTILAIITASFLDISYGIKLGTGLIGFLAGLSGYLLCLLVNNYYQWKDMLLEA